MRPLLSTSIPSGKLRPVDDPEMVRIGVTLGFVSGPIRGSGYVVTDSPNVLATSRLSSASMARPCGSLSPVAEPAMRMNGLASPDDPGRHAVRLLELAFATQRRPAPSMATAAGLESAVSGPAIVQIGPTFPVAPPPKTLTLFAGRLAT